MSGIYVLSSQGRTRLYIKPFVDRPQSCGVTLIEFQLCRGDNGGNYLACQDSYSRYSYGKYCLFIIRYQYKITDIISTNFGHINLSVTKFIIF